MVKEADSFPGVALCNLVASSDAVGVVEVLSGSGTLSSVDV